MLAVHIDNTDVYGGDVLKGTVILKVSKPLNFSGLEVSLIGKERTNLSKTVQIPPTQDSSSQTATVFTLSKLIPIGDSHKFLNESDLLWLDGQKKDKQDSIQLDPRGYYFPFSFELPKTLPPTVQYKSYALIEYYISAKLKSDKKKFMGISTKKVMNKITKKNQTTCPFRVLGSVCKEEIAKRSQDLQFSNTKSFIFSLHRGKILLSGSLPQSYAVRGDIIPIKIEIVNDSNKDVKATEIRVVRNFVVRVRDNDGEKYEERTFSEVLVATDANLSVKKKQRVDGEVNCALPDGIVPSFAGELFEVYSCTQIILLAYISGVQHSKLEAMTKDILVLPCRNPLKLSKRPHQPQMHNYSSHTPPLVSTPDAIYSSGSPYQSPNHSPVWPSVPMNTYTSNSPIRINVGAPQSRPPPPAYPPNNANVTPPPAYGSLTAPIGPVPFKMTQSGHFYDLPGKPYEPPPTYEESVVDPLHSSFFQHPSSSTQYPDAPMEQRMINVIQPDGSCVPTMGWVPVTNQYTGS